mmetsp:Transcript_12506/g.34720  ORF Transcript_12506/g.34720 Transcript_12506/m.34720 type:complete len:83 (-) Transcript_12506:95-343(-)
MCNWGNDPDSMHKTTIHDLTPKMMPIFKSIHTGNQSVPLKQRWLELDHSLSPVDMVEGNPGADSATEPILDTSATSEMHPIR